MTAKKQSIIVEQPELIRQATNDRNFQKWVQKYQVNTQAPLLIQNSFRNFQNPLQYIRDQKIKKLEYQSDSLLKQMKFQRQSIAEMSKSTYKKVVARQKIDYQFGAASAHKNNQYKSSYHQMHKRQAKKKDDNTNIINKREELKKKFIHNHNRSDLDNKNQLRNLTLQIIKEIDSKDFEQKYSDVQYFEVFAKRQEQKLASAFSDISQNYQMDELFSRLKLNVIDRDSYYGQKSTQYLFKTDEQLDFWRRYSNQNTQVNYADEIQIMKRCHNFDPKQPLFLHLLDFAAGKLDGQILSSFFKLKNKHEAQLKINQNDEGLQSQYYKKKMQYDKLRDMKMKDISQKVAIKFTKNTAQTIDNLEDLSFDSYFEESARDIILKIKQLNQIRDSVMEKNQNQGTKKTMLINIGHEIKNLLFKLLSLTLRGQNFVNYDEIIEIGQQSIAEKKILQIVYHQFHRITQLEVDGIQKTQILDIYLEEREKNEKIFQLLGRMYGQQKPKALTPKKDTKTATTKKK